MHYDKPDYFGTVTVVPMREFKHAVSRQIGMKLKLNWQKKKRYRRKGKPIHFWAWGRTFDNKRCPVGTKKGGQWTDDGDCGGPTKKKRTKGKKDKLSSLTKQQFIKLLEKLSTTKLVEDKDLWGVYQEGERRLKKTPYEPEVPADELPDHDPYYYNVRNDNSVKLVPLPENPDDYPDWLKQEILSGNIGFMASLSNISIPVKYPNKAHLKYTGFFNTERNAGKRRNVTDDIAGEEYKRAKWQRTVPALRRAFPSFRRFVIRDAKKNDNAGATLLFMGTGVRVDSSDGAWVPARTQNGKKVGGYYSYGATSIRSQHVKLQSNGLIRLEFRGKTGKPNVRIIAGRPEHAALDWKRYRDMARPLLKAIQRDPEHSWTPRERVLMKKVVRGLNNAAVYDPDLYYDLLRRKKRAGKKGKLYPKAKYTNTLSYVGTLGDKLNVPDLTPHNFRHRYANRAAQDGLIIHMLEDWIPENEKDLKKAIRQVGKFAGARVNDGPGPALKSYIDPALFALYKKKAGVTWTGNVPPPKRTPKIKRVLANLRKKK